MRMYTYALVTIFVAPCLVRTRVVNSMTVRQAQAYILQVRYSQSAQAPFPVG